MAAPTSGRGKGLTRAVVIEAALDLVDADGLAGLNFRALARRLGVTTMAPYSHFADKEDLLAAMAEHALGGLDDRLDERAPWDEQVAAAMYDLHAVLTGHPSVAELILAREEGERLADLRDLLVAVVVSAGLDETEAVDALRALVSYVLGFATLTRSGRPVQVRRGSAKAFDYGLDLLLDSLRARVRSAQPGDAPCR